MNQEQNNFNKQVNNGISNNHPLQNNQNLGTTVNQSINTNQTNHIQNQQVPQTNSFKGNNVNSQNLNTTVNQIINSNQTNNIQNQAPQTNSFGGNNVNNKNLNTTLNQNITSNQANNIQNQAPQTNSFGGNNVNNKNFTTKAKKKKKLGIIIGAISSIILIIIGVVIGIDKFGNNLTEKNNNQAGENSNNNDFSKVEQVEITGNAKFVKSFEGYSKLSECGNYYFTLQNDEKTIVVDHNGKTIASGNTSYHKPYCYDDGTIMFMDNKTGQSYSAYSYSVWRNGKKIYSFESHKNAGNYYENNILYYTTPDAYIKAYDLKEKKELWMSKTVATDPVVLKNVVVANSPQKGKNVLLSKQTGETIAENAKDISIYASYSDYYIKYYDKDKYLEVYDYSSNLISKLDLSTENNCKFGYILSNGYFVISCIGSNYSIYNYNCQEVKQIPNYYQYMDSRNVKNNHTFTSINILDNANVSVVESESSSEPSFIFYDNGNIINYYSRPSEFGVERTSYLTETSQRTFLYGRNEPVDNKLGDDIVLTNFLTGKQVNIGDGGYKSAYIELDNHFVIHDSKNGYSFYDKDLNTLEFKTTKSISPIVNEWVLLSYSDCIASSSCKQKLSIANILTGEEKEISVDYKEGQSGWAEKAVTRNGIITSSGEVYNLYKFN